MQKKWIRILAAGMASMLLVSGCSTDGANKENVQKPVHLTFGHGQAEGHPYHIAAMHFKEEVEKKTDGRVIVDVQPNGNLGDEREMTESLQLGTIDITVAVAATLSGFNQDLDVFNFPYLFDSREEAFKVLDGETGKKIFSGLDKQGIETFGTFDLGFRSMTNSKRPIVTPEDADGIRMRTLESSVCVDSLGQLGIDAVSMSFSELFTALQTKAVDGQENPLFTIYNSRFYEVQKYLSLTEHFYPVCPVMVGKLMWNKLSKEDAEIVREELYNMVDYERAVAGEELDKTLQQIEDAGMEVNTVDKSLFKQAISPVYEKYNAQYGDLLKEIEQAKER
uniref:TRAP transporter substrate-binding protein n=1 Tax=Candidatus Ventrimonas sp. TaxID=3048889 RepID=UPI003FF0A6BD